MAIVNACEKSRHLGDDVIVVVVHVQVNLFVFLWTGVDDFIAILFRHDTDLILGQVRLKQFGLVNPARTKRYAGILMKFLCQTRLQGSVRHSYMAVLWVVIELGFGNHESSRHAKFILVSYSYDRFLLFQMFLQIHFRAFGAFAPPLACSRESH